MKIVDRKSVDGERHAKFRAFLAAEELVGIAKADKDIAGKRMLDIGGAYGIHARYFRKNVPGLKVDIMDLLPGTEELIYQGDYLKFQPSEPYDFLWLSHIAEHTRNPGLLFDKIFADVKEGGWVGITVPPLQEKVTFPHLTLWNAGQLLIHLVYAGFDCREARVATYNYNVSVIVQKKPYTPRKNLKSLLPFETKIAHFDGYIKRLNWTCDAIPNTVVSTKPVAEAVASGECTKTGFFKALDENRKAATYYLDMDLKEVYKRS